jgi:hypothetical protein
LSSVFILFAGGGILSLIALTLNIIFIIKGFKTSIKQGLLALLAPLLLSAGLSAIYFASHIIALESVGKEQVRADGEKEMQKQVDELNNLDNLQLDL